VHEGCRAGGVVRVGASGFDVLNRLTGRNVTLGDRVGSDIDEDFASDRLDRLTW
jgi:hypothetical protein